MCVSRLEFLYKGHVHIAEEADRMACRYILVLSSKRGATHGLSHLTRPPQPRRGRKH